MISTVRPGVIEIYVGNQVKDRYVVSGGFAEVTGERCTVLAEEATPFAEVTAASLQERIARARIDIEMSRLLCLKAADTMDRQGNKAARTEISMIKVVAANVVMDVLDRAIQVHGSLGMSDDTPLAAMWRFSRMLKVADGPDEVHKMVIARRELNRYSQGAQ